MEIGNAKWHGTHRPRYVLRYSANLLSRLRLYVCALRVIIIFFFFFFFFFFDFFFFFFSIIYK